MGSFALVRGPSDPGLATIDLWKFYKVYSLAVVTIISHNYQVLLDDANRIIIPQGNLKNILISCSRTSDLPRMQLLRHRPQRQWDPSRTRSTGLCANLDTGEWTSHPHSNLSGNKNKSAISLSYFLFVKRGGHLVVFFVLLSIESLYGNIC